MEHTESAVKVYFTKKYGAFRTILGNRQLSELKIKKIRTDIENGLDVLRFCPILVFEQPDGRLDIIDGQHRYYVAMQIKTSIWYIICDKLNLMQIAKINSNTEKWKDRDFINCFAVVGNDNYVQLQRFMDKYEFPLSTSLSLLTRGTVLSEGGSSFGSKSDFREGRFVVRLYDQAVETAEKIRIFKDFRNHRSGGFAEAICRIEKTGRITLGDLYRKYKENPDMLTPQSNGKDYLNCLELLYNKGSRTRTTIY